MPVKRFSFLLSNLHLNDQTKEPKKGDANFDKFCKIRPFIEKISETYLHYYDPTRDQSIDESMVKFKGRSTIKRYMPQKTSNDLMITLLTDGISASETIMKDRKGLPKNQGKEKVMKMGDSEYRTSYEEIRSLKWVDKKPVQFL